MKIKTSKLEGAALDWAVAKAANVLVEIIAGDLWLLDYSSGEHPQWFPSDNWSQGGPIIEREYIWLEPHESGTYATLDGLTFFEGSTLLTAAMRCYVASKLGEEVGVPEELLQ